MLTAFLCLIFLFIAFFFVGLPKETGGIRWGVNFSQEHAEKLGLDWKETYLALLDDLGAKKIKIAVPWDLLEPEQGTFDFKDLDWQIQKAKERGVSVLLAIGMKTPRWPECHIPEWAKGLTEKEQKQRVLKAVEKTVLRYGEEESVWAWQAENEPFFKFGECPWEIDKEFLEKEISLIKEKDSLERPVIVTGSGEFSLWLKPARMGDIAGVTLYRKVWLKELKSYFTHLFPPVFYGRRAKLINWIFDKEVVCVELQAEPWTPSLIYNSTLKEQEKTMDLEQFKKNVNFAKSTGLKEFYFWGGEWWFWLKEKKGKPEIWQTARKMFQ